MSDSGGWELGGLQEQGVSLRGWGRKAEVKSVTSAFCTLTHWELVVW